jgi:L-lactate dehydrogenase complex protein LldF
MEIKTQQYRQVAVREMADEYTRQFLKLLPARLAERRKTAFADFADPQAAMKAGAAIRARAMENLPSLLETFEKNATEAGAHIHWAQDAAEANACIVKIAKENNISYVAKGKSMITEELGLNQALLQNGIQAWETDLGEFITQLMDRPPFHIVGPAINIPVDQISDVFVKNGVISSPETDPVRLGMAARKFLRQKFRDLKMGIVGVNMAVAESGTIINVENEGNIRLSKSCPEIQVAVMSLEKVVETFADAFQLLRLLCRSSTGQALGAYVSMDTGPKKKDEIDGPEALHIVILDNGRTRIYQNPETRQVLQCIRCGSCLNACPIYGKIGGYPYGWAYSGPMGQILTPLLLGFEKTQDLFKSCTLCGRCRHFCPVGIDHPKVICYLRSRNVMGNPVFNGKGEKFNERLAYGFYLHAASHKILWELSGRILRRILNRRAVNGQIKAGPKLFSGWFAHRNLPASYGGGFQKYRRHSRDAKGIMPGLKKDKS